MTSNNLAERAIEGELTVEEVNRATKEKLEEKDFSYGYTVLYWASKRCGIEVVEAILDKGVNIDGLSDVSIFIRLIDIKLTLVNN
jgi:hypothetical protein